MYHLITAAPGNGKTCYTLSLLHKITDRPIYYRGITNLTHPGDNWHKLTDDEAYEWHNHVPDTAIVVIDEVQEIFPIRPPSKPVPDGVQALEKHRHRGLDVYFITQKPRQLDVHARDLLNQHHMLERKFNMKMVTVYKYHKLMDENRSSSYADADRQTFNLNAQKHIFALYQSTVMDTHKFKIPRRMLVAAGVLILAIGAVFYGVTKISAKFGDDEIAQGETGQPEPEQTRIPVASGPKLDIVNPANFLSEYDGLPWMAPAYQESFSSELEVPRLAGCFSDKGRCVCYSQQNTRYFFSEEICRSYVASLPYQPHVKKKERETGQAPNYKHALEAQADLVRALIRNHDGTQQHYVYQQR